MRAKRRAIGDPELQRWQGCSTTFQVIAAGLHRQTSDGALFAAHANVHQAKVRAFAGRLDGNNVLVAFGTRFQFDRRAAVVAFALQLLGTVVAMTAGVVVSVP